MIRMCMDRFKNWQPPLFDEDGYAFEDDERNYNNRIPYGWRCKHFNNLKLGMNVDIGCFTYLNAKHGIVIGDDVQIGSHCSIYSIDTERNINGRVTIGKGCLIGSHCIILPNVVIKPFSKIPCMSVIK